MIPNREWIRQWVEKRPGLSSQVDLERYFTTSNRRKFH